MYKEIVRFLEIEAPPMDIKFFMEANVYDLVLLIIAPIIQHFPHRTGRLDVKLFRGK